MTLASAARRDQLELLSRMVTLASAALAVAGILAAPLLALSWVSHPFPGALVEQTLVVNRIASPGWTGREAGLDFPQRIERIGGVEVSGGAYEDVLRGMDAGETVAVLTRLPDGRRAVYPSVELIDLPGGDVLRLFVVPYVVGLTYVAIGLWAYRVRGRTRPGRVLAFFCFCAALACALIFDLWTTHVAVALWTVAVSFASGAVLSLAMRFPVEWRLATRHPWVLGVPYVLSGAVALDALLHLEDPSDPWAYIGPWGRSYRLLAMAFATFMLLMLGRAARSRSADVRRQARVVVLGSALAFGPLVIWLLAPVVGRNPTFDPVVFLPPLVLFPASIWIAILRYRLLEADVIVNRTLLYGALTAVLAGVFTVTITIFQKTFVAFTGASSDAALVLATLVMVSLVTPIRERLQKLLEARLKSGQGEPPELAEFGSQVRLVGALGRPEAIASSFLEQASASARAASGAVRLRVGSRWVTAAALGDWRGDARLAVPIGADGEQVGVLVLGPPSGRPRYAREEVEALGRLAGDVARAIRVARALESLGSGTIAPAGVSPNSGATTASART